MHIQTRIWTLIASFFTVVAAVAIVLSALLDIATVPSDVAQLPQIALWIMGLPNWFSLGLVPFLSIAWVTWVLIQERRWGQRVEKLDEQILSLRCDWTALDERVTNEVRKLDPDWQAFNQRASLEVQNAVKNNFDLFAQSKLYNLETSITETISNRDKSLINSVILEMNRATTRFANMHAGLQQKISSIEDKLNTHS